MMTNPAETARYLERNAVDSLPDGELEKKLELAGKEGRPLRVKLGIDPTAPDIHLGHTVVLQKLREFQDRGHKVVLIIGDFTARVGDPSGQTATRPMLEVEEIDRNAKTFQEQAFKILDVSGTEVRRNSEWLNMPMEKLFELMRKTTVAQILERDDFEKRYREGKPITLLETLYSVLQGYDSVAIEADIEVGGTDQKFNLLMGRQVQQSEGYEPQAILTMPILPGTDGRIRMSKSIGNYVGVTDPPEEIFGKVMSIPDDVMGLYYELLLGEDEPDLSDPNQAKRTLGRGLVARYYDHDSAGAAEEHFDRVHKYKQAPDEVVEVLIGRDQISDGKVHIPRLISENFDCSRSQARRFLEQRGVRLDDEVLGGDELDLPAERLDGALLKVGKRRFRKTRLIK